MTDEEKRAEEAKRERAFDPVQRWEAIQAAIAFAEANMPPEKRRNRPRWHPGNVSLAADDEPNEPVNSPAPQPRDVYALADLQNWPAATAGLEPPLRLAVFGDPVAHSASPPMHNAALAACGRNVGYTRLHIPPADLAAALRLLAPQGFIGANLTIPHKTAALPLLDEIDPQAAELGAVNTVRVEPDGRLRGFNTDGPGLTRALREELDAGLAGRRVLLLGAGGGAGRALAVQCLLEGCGRLFLANRTFDKTRALAEELSARFSARNVAEIEATPWQPDALAAAAMDADLVINASALGLKPADASPLPDGCLSARALVFDTVYRRDGTPTPLLKAARQAGAHAVGGLALLLHQGALSFEHWFGQPAPVNEMRRALEAAAHTNADHPPEGR